MVLKALKKNIFVSKLWLICGARFWLKISKHWIYLCLLNIGSERRTPQLIFLKSDLIVYQSFIFFQFAQNEHLTAHSRRFDGATFLSLQAKNRERAPPRSHTKHHCEQQKLPQRS